MKKTYQSLWKMNHLKVVRAEDVGYPDESSVMIDGSAFTGVLVEEDSADFDYFRVVVRGRNDGPCYYRRDDGTLAEYGNYYGGLDRGPSHEWDEHGNLIDEVFESSDSSYVRRMWSASGQLIFEGSLSGEVGSGNKRSEAFLSNPWIRVPSLSGGSKFGGGVEAVLLNALAFGELVSCSSEPYTGKSISSLKSDVIEVRSFIEGLEFGPYWMCSPGGDLILQGVRCHLSGKVGPWHEWDEQGRLLRETIYDALGNKIIHRELDEHQNIVSQERFEPTTLMTDPETGEQYPAPWL